MTVKHKTLHQQMDSEVSDEDFIVVINTALDNVIEEAYALGKTVDWNTLQIEPNDEIETFTASGHRQSYSLGLHLRVDSVSIEEDE
jgi:hypothetical protein